MLSDSVKIHTMHAFEEKKEEGVGGAGIIHEKETAKPTLSKMKTTRKRASSFDSGIPTIGTGTAAKFEFETVKYKRAKKNYDAE